MIPCKKVSQVEQTGETFSFSFIAPSNIELKQGRVIPTYMCILCGQASAPVGMAKRSWAAANWGTGEGVCAVG